MRFEAARPRLEDPLLRYSLAEFESVIFPAFQVADVRNVVEIGAEGGGFTEHLAKWVTERDGKLISVDPAPSELVRKLAAEGGPVTLEERTSLDVLPELAACDAYLLDGDHNYYTVTAEMRSIVATAEKAGTHPLMILQDLAWPAGHRDQYYDPESIPDSERQPYDYGGAVPWEAETQAGRGFRGEGEFAFASVEGGQHNGVGQALEDFLAAHDELDVISLPCIFGLGFVYFKAAPWAERLRQEIGALDDHPLLAGLESNRLRLYLALLDTQDALTKERRRFATTEADMKREIDGLRAELELVRTTGKPT